LQFGRARRTLKQKSQKRCEWPNTDLAPIIKTVSFCDLFD
jgi:hypothetical protein